MPTLYGDESIKYFSKQEQINLYEKKSYRLTKHSLESEDDFIGLGMATSNQEFFALSCSYFIPTIHSLAPGVDSDHLLMIEILL